MAEYKMTVEIPVKEVPDNVPIEEVTASSKIWLLIKIPDAKMVSLEKVEE